MTNLEKIILVNKEHYVDQIVKSYCITEDYEIIRAKATNSYPCSKCRFAPAKNCQERMRKWLLEEVNDD